MQLLDKILIANRGEIALRIIRSAKSLGIRTVAVYTESDSDSGYVQSADEAYCLGADDLNSSYLNIGKIIATALSSGSQAIHPGYGFLSENAGFARACEAHQLIFIGPQPEVLAILGNKPEAKSLAASLGIPVLTGRKIDINSITLTTTQETAFPVLIKPAFGGGGKGMKLILNHAELVREAEKATRIAENYFGNGELFTEQYLRNARHVEVQLLGDHFGHIIHLYERECSIQRNHQKIIEEAPALFLTPELRVEILAAAVKIGKAVHYTGAGTVEFLVDESGNFYFMEMNPRIQVEHGITEQITGIDIVSEQLKIASGLPLSITQDQVKVNGHAIELRVYSENPAENFAPSSKALLSVNLPSHPLLRIEADIPGKEQVKSLFDPLLFKLIGWGKDRQCAIALLMEQVANLNILGPETNTKYLESILAHTDYLLNQISTDYCTINHQALIDSYLKNADPSALSYLIAFAVTHGYKNNDSTESEDPWKNLGYWRIAAPKIDISVDQEIYRIFLKLNDTSNPSFELNEVVTPFSINERSKNSISIEINGVVRAMSFITDDRNNLSIGFRNRHHQVSFPGLLKSYPESPETRDDGVLTGNEQIHSPLHGRILKIATKKNQIIKKGDLLLVIEAMKIENQILSSRAGRVKNISVNVGDQVTHGMPLIYLEDLQ
jgi:acetyl/propionyl-CoA carboxylase alpha subunit